MPFDFDKYPDTMNITPESLAYFIRNGYELKLYNRKKMKATSAQVRILIPVVPVIGSILRRDFPMDYEGDFYKHAEEAGCVKFNVSICSDLSCEFKAQPGVILRVPEVYAFISSFHEQGVFYGKGKQLLMQFAAEGLADDFSKLYRNPMEISGRNIHVGTVLRVIDFIEQEALGQARRAFLDCDDFSRAGLIKFCKASGRI